MIWVVNFWLFSLALNEWINTIFPVLLRGSSQLNSTRLMIFNVLYNFSNFKFICGTFLWYARAIVVYFKYFLFFAAFFEKGTFFCLFVTFIFRLWKFFLEERSKFRIYLNLIEKLDIGWDDPWTEFGKKEKRFSWDRD